MQKCKHRLSLQVTIGTDSTSKMVKIFKTLGCKNSRQFCRLPTTFYRWWLCFRYVDKCIIWFLTSMKWNPNFNTGPQKRKFYLKHTAVPMTTVHAERYRNIISLHPTANVRLKTRPGILFNYFWLLEILFVVPNSANAYYRQGIFGVWIYIYEWNEYDNYSFQSENLSVGFPVVPVMEQKEFTKKIVFT